MRKIFVVQKQSATAKKNTLCKTLKEPKTLQTSMLWSTTNRYTNKQQ